MGGSFLGIGFSSAIVNDFDIVGMSIVPTKADSVPIVDPDAMLPDASPFQWLQPVAGRSQELAQLGCEVQHPQFSPCNGFDVDETGDPFALEQPFGIGASERPDHPFRILRFT